MDQADMLRRRAWVELAASLFIWLLPVMFGVLFFLRRWRLGRYMRRNHPREWEDMGGGSFFVNHGRFGAFLFDSEEDYGDERLRRLKRGLLLMLGLAMGSTVLAWVLNFLSDRYVSKLLGV